MIRCCFLLLFLLSPILSTDYKKCQHLASRKELRCKGNELGAVPANLPANLIKLDIKDDDLSAGFEFPHLTRLRKLYLSNVHIGKEFPKLAFANLPNLQDLRIFFLPKKPDGNYTITIHPEAFHGLTQLSTVRFINLGLRELPDYMFRESSKLRQIYINGMEIQRIGRNTFAPLEKIQQLNLMHNQLHTIEEGAFDCVDSSYRAPRIYLSRNNLKTIPVVADDIEILIHDNPIVCDCKLTIPISFKDKRAKCAAPPALKGTYLHRLRDTTVQCVCHSPVIPHGTASGGVSLQPGESFYITCDPGYGLNSDPNLVCQEDGTFGDAVIPQCIEIEVGPVELEDGSLQRISNAFSVYPNYLQLECPDNSVVKSCKCVEEECRGVVLDDTWCRVYAAESRPTRGDLICVPEVFVVDQYTYHSADDYTHTIGCLQRFDVTTCTNYNPGNRVIGNHGVVEWNQRSCSIDCGNEDCELYIRCVDINVPVRPPCDKFGIYSGIVTLDGVEVDATTDFREGDVVTVSCNEGYEIDLVEDQYLSEDGLEAYVTCIEGVNLDPPEMPECFEIVPMCELEMIDDVEASPSWIVYEGDSITLSCGRGYQGEDEIIECEMGGVYQQPTIQCQPRELSQCHVPPASHVTLTREDQTYFMSFTLTEGEVLIATCEEGYEASTPQTRITCLESGELSQDIPECTEIQESETLGCMVPFILHGTVVGHSPRDTIDPGTILNVECNEGYDLRDPTSTPLTCVSNQNYQPNRLPRCDKRIFSHCEVPQLANGYYPGYGLGEEVPIGTVLFARCDQGYILKGPIHMACTDVNFGGQVNTCEREKIDCSVPTLSRGRLLTNGKPFRENDSFPIVCDRGYYNAYTYVTCVVGPSFYDPYSVPDCLRPEYGCPKVGFPLMKPLLEEPERGDSVEVECMSGYTLVGQSTLTCGQNFDYTARVLPECVPIAGCEIPVIENGSTNTSQSHLESGVQLSITCDEGYAVYGDSLITCNEGEWSGIVVPECRPQDEISPDCVMPFTFDGHFMPLAGSYVNSGSTLVLHCDEGFGVEDGVSNQVMCVTRNVFQPSLLPECVELAVTGCPAPSIGNARLTPSTGVRVGRRLSVTCEEGFELQGPSEVECAVDGTYHDLPTCREIQTMCPVPDIPNAIISPLEPIAEGQYYLVVCESGYVRDGEDMVRCESDGVTNISITPLCREIPEPCQKPNITNGFITSIPSSRQNSELYNTYDNIENLILYEEEAYVICSQPNYGPPHTKITCKGNNRFEPPVPTCVWEGPSCEFPVVANGVVSPQLDIVKPWATLTITCNEGFEKNPKVDIQCLHDRDVAYFNNKIPVCEQVKVKCTRPHIEHGYINGPDPLETDDRFTVECNEGYELVGAAGPLVCYKDEIYSRRLPFCQKKNMNNTECFTPFVQNAKIVGTPFTGYYITVVCKEGYFIKGQSRLQCLSNGQYDHQMPQCVARDIKPHEMEDMEETECGQRSSIFIQRIYGGTNAEPGEYPWNVLIEFTRGRFCGGSIINRNWVLTAGHCLLYNFYRICNNREDEGCRLMNPRDIVSIKAGINNLDEYEDGSQVRTALEVVVHPYFMNQPKFIDYDVGLIRVNQPFDYNYRINRVCLPRVVGHLEGNGDLHVSGWGKTNASLSSDVLQKISVPYVSRDRCNQNISYNGVITETMFCAGYQQGKIDACQGDSGGPLVYLGSNGTFIQGGIISWGNQCALENFYGVYTNLAYFYTWIMSYIKVN